MDPLITDVFDGTRGILDDIHIAGGEIFTNDVLQRPFSLAYRELFDAMLVNGIKSVEQLAYYSLPPFTTILTPAQVGITNFGEPVRLRERGAVTDKTITAISTVAGGLQVTTSSPHGLGANSEVTVWGVVGETGANGRFFVDVTDSTNIVLRGAQSVSTYVSGGTVTYGTSEGFVEMHLANDILPQGTPDVSLNNWLWRTDRFSFQGASTERELEITYTASGLAPSTGTVGVDDSLNYLTFATAKHACVGREAYSSLMPYLNQQTAIALAGFIQIIVRTMLPRRARSFRSRFRSRGF